MTIQQEDHLNMDGYASELDDDTLDVGTSLEDDELYPQANSTDSDDDEDGAPKANRTIKKTPEQLQKERVDAIAEAVKNSKKFKAARAEVEYFKVENQVLKNPDHILQVHKKDPELANQIAESLWGMSYTSLLQKAQGGNTMESNPEDNMEDVVERTLQKREERMELENIERVATRFWYDKDVSHKSPTFTKVMRDFRTYTPRTVKDAEKLLNMLYRTHKGEEDVENIDLPASPRSSSSSTSSKQQNRKQLLQAAETFGISAEILKKYGKL